MSLERVIKALVNLGLSRMEAEVYVYLANNYPQKAVVLVSALNLTKSKTYACLRNLQKKGLVTKEGAMFSALPFEEVLDLLIKTEKQLTESLQKSEKELLTSWKKKD